MLLFSLIALGMQSVSAPAVAQDDHDQLTQSVFNIRLHDLGAVPVKADPVIQPDGTLLVSADIQGQPVHDIKAELTAHEARAGMVTFPSLDAVMAQERAPRTMPAALAMEDENGGWIETEDGLLHTISGMTCAWAHPVVLGEDEMILLALSDITVYDDKGYDTSCDYLSEDQHYYYTVYASYWPDVSLQEHFEAAAQIMLSEFPFKEVTPVVTSGMELDNGDIQETLAAGFLTQPLNNNEYFTGVWLNKANDWHVKVRATFTPAELGPQLSAALLHSMTMVKILNKEQSNKVVVAPSPLRPLPASFEPFED